MVKCSVYNIQNVVETSAHVVAYGVERSTRFGMCSGGGGDNIFSILADGKF